MLKPIGIQLYSVREALAQDFEGVIRRIAGMGYAGVEPAGFPGTTAANAARLFAELGLQVPSAHIALPLGNQKNEVLDTMALLGARYLVCAYLPHHQFERVDQIKANCDRLNEASAVARGAGLKLVYHNHWWEYLKVDGRYAYQIMNDMLDPDILFEIDTYWVAVAGRDPVSVVREHGARAPLLHIKDGPLDKDAPMVAVGDGKMDFAPIINAAEDSAEWLIVELDRSATDMLEAVEKSVKYLQERGLGRGRQN